MFDFFNNRLFDLNRDGKVDIFEKAFVYHTLFEDDDKAVSRNVRNDDYDDYDDDCDCDDCDDDDYDDECDCDDCDDDFYDF
ncbi:unknown [Ruminococcus sp. CAG:353]|jgi:hypothetical protein|nr:hypothetical protein [Ruminococcus sp.]CDE80895.1 unknown [Ruminococcus sp. CAG:353]